MRFSKLKSLKKSYSNINNKLNNAKDYAEEKFNKTIKVIRRTKITIENAEESINPIKQIKKYYTEEDEDFRKADHLTVQRIGYVHHGIYYKKGTVIHYQDNRVRIGSLEEFALGGKILKGNSIRSFKKKTVIARALSRLKEKEYNLIFNNCEHFVHWCRNNEKFDSVIIF